MKIDILCSDGSPLGITSKTLWGDANRVGLGGSEYALITMCEEWTKAGHEVILYNNPWELGVSPFEQRAVGDFSHKENRDVLIVFRSPNPKAVVAKGLKVWWSCDQYTIGDFKAFAPSMDKIVCISPFHARYFEDTYDITHTTVIDLPIRVDDFNEIEDERIPNRIIFTSVPDRGLENLWRLWPIIKRTIKDASLVITADYRLWGVDARNDKHRVRWMAHEDIIFRGAISRKQLLYEQMKAQLLAYPCSYDELFCIAVAEAQYAGVYPVTSSRGALETTNMGTIVNGNPDDPRQDKLFADKIIEKLSDQGALSLLQYQLHTKAYERFKPERILEQWEKEIFS